VAVCVRAHGVLGVCIHKVYMYIRIYIYMFIDVCRYICMCIDIFMCILIFVYIYTYIYIFRLGSAVAICVRAHGVYGHCRI